MALHFYMGGTTNNQDGTEISNGDLTNPLIFDGAYPAAGTTLEKSITIHIRADAGETWKGVVVGGTSQTKMQVANRIFFGSNSRNSVINISGANNSSATRPLYLQSVSDVNIAIIVTAFFYGNDTNSPDTSVKIAVMQGCKVDSTTGLVTQVLAGEYTAGTVSDNLMVLFGGTPNKTDGTEITNITSFKNVPYGLSGIYGSEYTVGGVVPLCLRARTGYRMDNVKIESVLRESEKGFGVSVGYSSWPTEVYTSSYEEITIGTVTDSANVLIYLTNSFSYSGTATSITLQNAFVKSYVETYVGA